MGVRPGRGWFKWCRRDNEDPRWLRRVFICALVLAQAAPNCRKADVWLINCPDRLIAKRGQAPGNSEAFDKTEVISKGIQNATIGFG
jgi:hypothetical protein